MLAFDKFVNKYYVNVEIIAQTPIHVGSGEEGLSPLEVDNSVLKDSQGNAVIPGSTLKGVFRSTLEQILKSKNIKVCEEENGKPCIDQKERKKYKTENEWFAHIEENICEVCNLFGSNSFSSRVFFSDAIADQNRQNIENRDGIKIRRDTEITADKAKYDYEIVSVGTTFKTDILMENVEDYQVGYILFLIDMVNNGLVRFGGKKSVGLGKLKFNYKISSIDLEDITQVRFEPQPLDPTRIEEIKKATLDYLAKAGEKNV